MNYILQTLSDNASAITALATFVIAMFSIFTWLVSRRIHQASIQRHKEMNQMYVNLVSAIMVSGKTIGEPKLGARLFEQQRKELLVLFYKAEAK